MCPDAGTVELYVASRTPKAGYLPARYTGEDWHIQARPFLCDLHIVGMLMSSDRVGPVLDIRMTPEGRRALRDATAANTGGYIAEFVDGELASVSRVGATVDHDAIRALVPEGREKRWQLMVERAERSRASQRRRQP